MSTEQYLQARRDAQRVAHACQSRGEDPSLPVLDELVPNLNRLSQVSLGLTQIAMDQIAGTVTKGRTTAFTRGFLPLLESSSEFADKWMRLYDAVVEEGLRDPIVVMEYYNRYYVVEGNKRVSVMRRLDSPLIEANVTRVMPEAEDSERYRVYQEFLTFYAATKIDCVLFEHEGDYARLCHLAGKEPGDAWTQEERDDFKSCYSRFAQAYAQEMGSLAPISVGGALLTYLDVFGYAGSAEKTPSQFAADIVRIRPEFAVAAAKKPAAVLGQPAEKPPTIVASVKSALRGKPLRCAFLYNSSPDTSGWTYWHELGRKALEASFGSHVQTVMRDNVAEIDSQAAMEELIGEKYDVIFACSPVFLDACIRESVAHPEVKILNCSLLAIYHKVRSYYLRIHEAKFILGAIAGVMTENDLIGYVADYPIVGLPACVNAFALGAQMTNPRAKILLDWTTLPGHDPQASLAAQGERIFSNRDIRAPHMDTNAFGLYRLNDGQIENLAIPVWNWGRLYQGIVRSILSAAYAGEGAQSADRAMNYYMGMSTGAIDIICSKRLPEPQRRLVELLHARIREGTFLPFVGPLYDQEKTLRTEHNVALTPQQIIGLDYLADNVIGRLPAYDELSPVAQKLAALQGVRESAGPNARRTSAPDDPLKKDAAP